MLISCLMLDCVVYGGKMLFTVAKLRNNAETEGLRMFPKTSQMGSETFGKPKYTFGKQLIAFYLF